jgi:hypothetical protein
MMKNFCSLMLSLVLSIWAGIPAAAAEKGAGQKITPQSATPAINTSNSASSGAWSQMRALDQQEKLDLQNLSQQMADLKERNQRDTAPLQQQMGSLNAAFQSAMKQLRDQYDETRNRDDDERAALMDRIRPGYLSFYNQKKGSLASVNGREDDALQSLHQQEEVELQSIREKYDAQRKSLQQESAAQRQAINSQFDTEVKRLK